MVYLDNNATTQVSPEVLEAMRPYFLESFGNPSAIHHFGKKARDTVGEIRSQIAEKVGCCAEEIFFTASGSEANNLCLKGCAFANREKGNHIITSKIEHPSILNSCAFLEELGFSITYLDVDTEGFVDPASLKETIRPDTILISIAHVNNEIGTIQPLEELVAVSQGIPFHSDMVQSFLKTDWSLEQAPLSMASFSGHKFHAPKGIGFIYKRKGVPLHPLIHGGQQEGNVRSGTENVPYIVGLGEAIDAVVSGDVERMKELQSYLISELKKVPGVRLNGPQDLTKRVCTNVNVSCDALEGEVILNELSAQGIYVSTGAACASNYSRVSHVLDSIHCPSRFIHGNVRVGISQYTSMEELDLFLTKFKEIIGTFSLCRMNYCT